MSLSDDCNKNYIEVRAGSSKGSFLKKYCKNSVPAISLMTDSHQVYVKYVTGTEDSSFSATWKTGAGSHN